MEEIKRQIARARRRMNLVELLRLLSWSLTAALAVACIGLVIPRIWALNVEPQIWAWSWIGGAIAAGLALGILLGALRRRGDLEAAIELDRRFGLKERISSSLSLSPQDRDTDFGQALLSDAARRVERLDVREQFAVPFHWRNLLPLVPALALCAVVFFIPLAQSKAGANTETLAQLKERKIKAAAELEKKMAEHKNKLEEKGLKDVGALLDEMAKKAQELKKDAPGSEEKKDVLVKLNDMVKELQKRKQDLAANDKFKKQLEELKDLEKGPADKAAEALQEGNLAEAAKEMGKLVEKMKKGELTKEDRQKLAKQLEQVQNKIEEMRAQHEQKKQELQEQIEQKKNAGELGEAAKLQEQLDELKAQDKKMNGAMKKMAEKLGQAAKEMKEGGDPKAGAEAMQELADDLKDMQDQLAEMDALDEALDDIQDAKDAMNCDQCNGEGCKACQGKKKGQGQGKGKGEQPGNGLGEGQGFGARPEEKTDTKGYDSRVRSKADKGKSVRIGDADGPNQAGRAQQTTAESVATSLAEEPDPIDDTALPRDQREHSKEYFEKLLKGE